MSSEVRPTLRFGIMCQGTRFPAWQADCIRRLLELDGVELALLVLDKTPRHSPAKQVTLRSRVQHLITGDFSLWDLYCRVFVNHFSQATRPVDLSHELANTPTIP